MLQDEVEEQLLSLKREVDELRAEIAELKRIPSDDEQLLPDVEYDFVVNAEEKVALTSKGRIVGVVQESNTLGLTDEEWNLYTSPDE
jgi:hypothetical protein